MNLAYAALYLIALALVSRSWLGIAQRAACSDGPSARSILIYGLLLHGIVICGPPFLSDDVLFYSALGRALALHPQSGAAPLCATLGASDPFVSILDAHWRCSVSSYLPGFHLVARTIGQLAGGDRALHLRLYQAVSGGAMLLSAALVATSFEKGDRRRASCAALVALNPLSLIEGTMNAHNDALLAVSSALLVCAIRRRKIGLGMISLGLGLLIKLSALLLTGLYVAHHAFLMVKRRAPRLWRLSPLIFAVGIAGGLLFLALFPSALPGLSGLIGSPRAPWEYCTRSLECLPRAILRWGLHRPAAAWALGLFVRFLGGLWLLYAAFRSQERLLPWLATGLLVYYLYLHAWSQSWYLLPLLPLLPWAEGSTARALRCVSISSCAYYALVLVGNCFAADLAIATTDLAQGLVVVVPPSVILWRGRRLAALGLSSRIHDV